MGKEAVAQERIDRSHSFLAVGKYEEAQTELSFVKFLELKDLKVNSALADLEKRVFDEQRLA
jgi:hypothetical protein